MTKVLSYGVLAIGALLIGLRGIGRNRLVFALDNVSFYIVILLTFWFLLTSNEKHKNQLGIASIIPSLLNVKFAKNFIMTIYF